MNCDKELTHLIQKKLPNKENKDIFGFGYYIFFYGIDFEGGGRGWRNLEKIFIGEVTFTFAGKITLFKGLSIGWFVSL